VPSKAWNDPYGGYACDGDDRWTPLTVRDWWSDRRRVESYVSALLTEWSASTNPQELETVAGMRDFIDYMADGLATDLRRYLFRLEEGHYPGGVALLPDL
jgi:hypothetical protein